MIDDCPQDMLTHAAAEVLGLERLTHLVEAAEEAGDQWLLGKRAILAGHLVLAAGEAATGFDWFRRGLDALVTLSTLSASYTPEQVQSQEALELETLGGLCVQSNPQDAKYMARMEHLTQQEHLNRCTHLICSRSRMTVMHYYGFLK